MMPPVDRFQLDQVNALSAEHTITILQETSQSKQVIVREAVNAGLNLLHREWTEEGNSFKGALLPCSGRRTAV